MSYYAVIILTKWVYGYVNVLAKLQ